MSYIVILFEKAAENETEPNVIKQYSIQAQQFRDQIMEDEHRSFFRKFVTQNFHLLSQMLEKVKELNFRFMLY